MSRSIILKAFNPFSGRLIRRHFIILNALIYALTLGIVPAMAWGHELGVPRIILSVPPILIVLLHLATATKRLRDANLSPMFAIFALTPMLSHFFIFTMALWPPSVGRNRFGRDPRNTSLDGDMRSRSQISRDYTAARRAVNREAYQTGGPAGAAGTAEPRRDQINEQERAARAFLGLSLQGRLKEDDLMSAYRKKRRETHPDAGGSTEQFVMAEDAYQVIRQARRPAQA